jgi:hypothetical protein
VFGQVVEREGRGGGLGRTESAGLVKLECFFRGQKNGRTYATMVIRRDLERLCLCIFEGVMVLTAVGGGAASACALLCSISTATDDSLTTSNTFLSETSKFISVRIHSLTVLSLKIQVTVLETTLNVTSCRRATAQADLSRASRHGGISSSSWMVWLSWAAQNCGMGIKSG